ncbi:MAG TPA: cytidylate kinase-like family protein [Bacteroidetes bacterium]|nr:cytidylate kinase-like family protein [Bacteroidota bacterium]
MAKINLSKYAYERLLERERHVVNPGPVITISREYGCPSKPIAALLTDLINEKYAGKNKWHWISKEILEETARKLGLTPREIKHIFEYKERNLLEDLLIGQEKKNYYRSDWSIRKTLGEVIHATAMEGHCIIVGRAGVALTRDIEASLHVKLIAPEQWRTVQVTRIHDIPYEKASKLIREMDNKRKKFIEYYLKKEASNSIFDVIFNCSTLSKEEVAQTILKMARQKKLSK